MHRGGDPLDGQAVVVAETDEVTRARRQAFETLLEGLAPPAAREEALEDARELLGAAEALAGEAPAARAHDEFGRAFIRWTRTAMRTCSVLAV
jgi:hypothetical protein